MYLLNKMAAEEGCAILRYHLRKADKAKGGKRQDISISDLYGSAFIGAGTSDIWGIIKDPEQPNDTPKFLLKVLKPRTGGRGWGYVPVEREHRRSELSGYS